MNKKYYLKQDPLISNISDNLTDIPTKYRLRHNKNCSKKGKRAIRKVLNNIRPEIDSKINELLIFGETEI